MIKTKNIKFLLVFTFSIASLVLLSQKQKDSIRVTEIEEIIAEGKRQTAGIISYQKLSGKELENLNSLSVADAIRFFSGVQLKDYGGVGGMKTVNIRGMGSQHVGVFYDGIQLGNAQNGTVDLGKFSLDNMESIFLYNGQKSEIFQSAKDFGSAGSIYLVTKKPRFQDEKTTNLNINYRSGSFAFINPSVLWEQKLSPTINSSLNFEYINSDGKYKFRQKDKAPDGSIGWDTTAIRKNGNISAFRAEAGLFGKVNKGDWSLKGYYYDSSRGIPGAIVKNVYKRYEKQWDTNFFIQGSFLKEITSNYKILVNVKYAYDFTHYVNKDIKTMYIENTYKQKEFYISTAQQYSLFSFWDIALSTDYQYNTLDADLTQFAYPKRNTELIALATTLNFNRFKFQTSILGSFVQEKVGKVGSEAWAMVSPDKEEFTPTVFLNYKLLKKTDLSIHAFYKRIFRMPTFNDLYYTEIGNSLLKPEYTTQYDIGINYNKDFNSGTLRNISLIVDAYHNEVKDKIIAAPKGQQFRWSMYNLGKVRILGLETSLQSSLLITKELLFNLRAVYTYEKAMNITSKESEFYKDQIPYIPWHSGSLLIGMVYKNWNVNYSFMYTGERYNSPANIPTSYEKEWYTHDLSLSKEISLNNVKLKAGIEINNLLDKQYTIIQHYPMPGRNYRLSLRINL